MSSRSDEFITLKEAATLSGYSSDYLGQLIRNGKLEGKQVFSNVSWVTTEDAVRRYLEAKTQGTSPIKNSSVNTISSEHLEKLQGAVWWLVLCASSLLLLLLFYVFSVSIDKRLSRGYTTPTPEELSALEITPKGL